MEYVKGATLKNVVSSIYDTRIWSNLSLKDQNVVITLLLDVIDVIGNMHEAGYVHRNITPDNFLVNKYDDVVMIDLKHAYSLGEDEPSPPYGQGTPGYSSPAQLLSFGACTEDDIYGLGALLLWGFSNLPPLKFDIDNPDRLVRQLTFLGVPYEIQSIIQQCLSEDASERPDLSEIRAAIEKLYSAEE